VQTLNIDTGAGQLKFLTGAGPGLGYFDITYGTAASPLNLDLTSGGANAFSFITKWDVGGVLLDQPPNFFSVFTAAGQSAASVSDVRGGIVTVLPDGRRQVLVPFSAFTPQFDPTKVLRIELDFVRIAQGSEFTLGGFGTVPEPTGIVLAFVASVASNGYRRRCGRLKVWVLTGGSRGSRAGEGRRRPPFGTRLLTIDSRPLLVELNRKRRLFGVKVTCRRRLVDGV
jgi:hypothetical protein